MSSAQASVEPSPASESEAATETAMAGSVEPEPTESESAGEPEPTEVPEALRERHDRLVAAIEQSPNDVASICALASILRRAGMLTEAGARLDDAERIVDGAGSQLSLAPGTVEACAYERGRIAEEREDWTEAREAHWRAMTTPIERRRPIVAEAFVRAAKREVEADCDSISTLSVRALLSIEDDPAFRRCLRERERIESTCEILRLDDARHPGFDRDSFDDYAPVGSEGAAFGLLADQLYAISVIGGRKQVRLCGFDMPRDARLAFPRVLELGDDTLFYISVTKVVPYTCECEEGEQGHPDSPYDCRCEDLFDIRFLFTDRGELRLALIDDYSSVDAASVRWDQPHLRESNIATPRVEGEVLRMGRRLRLRSHVLVPAD